MKDFYLGHVRLFASFAPGVASGSGKSFGRSCAYALFAKDFADSPESFSEDEVEEQRRLIDAKRKVTILMNRYGYPPLPSPNAYQMYTKECFEKTGKGQSVANVMSQFAKSWKTLSVDDRQKLEEKVAHKLDEFSHAVQDWETKMKRQKLSAVLNAINLGIRTIDSKQGPRRLLQKQLDILKKQYNYPDLKLVKPYSIFVHEKLKRSSGSHMKQTDRLKQASEEWNALSPAQKVSLTERAESINQTAKDKISSWKESMENKGLTEIVERMDWIEAKVRYLSRRSKLTNVEQLLETIITLKSKTAASAAKKKG
ncbi:Transcription factor A, mitochondrial [Trichuris trichiura]|uniref:Transcription factor A, mitochondrial n=1 Tax=Trichuris trichiura TaxID=36087 RepID=A0A077YZX3_TRITR|nr:Transcription factor A, mitochondrial [Trichuris trichiura]